ncbi:EnY2 domain-containing protein [Rhizoctonia solani AG-1 IA]|uniref:EnY2 domain-containing protein n=1 Tax=Thanatephorus cucumeris (strain AG1-IA) TaxID=983506 RepID=L8WX61_THACA|nr:EnY2 domain-containing protein [Rhizoctonia solani AG-1 IA]
MEKQTRTLERLHSLALHSRRGSSYTIVLLVIDHWRLNNNANPPKYKTGTIYYVRPSCQTSRDKPSKNLGTHHNPSLPSPIDMFADGLSSLRWPFDRVSSTHLDGRNDTHAYSPKGMQDSVPRSRLEWVAGIRSSRRIRFRAPQRNTRCRGGTNTQNELDPIHQEQRESDLGVRDLPLAVVHGHMNPDSKPDADDGQSDELDRGVRSEPFLKWEVGAEVSCGERTEREEDEETCGHTPAMDLGPVDFGYSKSRNDRRESVKIDHRSSGWTEIKRSNELRYSKAPNVLVHKPGDGEELNHEHPRSVPRPFLNAFVWCLEGSAELQIRHGRAGKNVKRLGIGIEDKGWLVATTMSKMYGGDVEMDEVESLRKDIQERMMLMRALRVHLHERGWYDEVTNMAQGSCPPEVRAELIKQIRAFVVANTVSE